MIKAVYPGSFDPITNGHLNIINRASKLYDELIVLVAISPAKKPFFSIEEKVNMIKDSVKNLPNVKVDFYEGLVVDYASKNNTYYADQAKNFHFMLKSLTEYNKRMEVG